MKTMTPKEVTFQLARTLTVLDEEADRAMHEALDVTRLRESQLAPHGETGRLGDRISTVVRHTQTGVTGTVRPLERRVANWVEHGTGVEHDTGYGKPIRTRPERDAGTGRTTLRFKDASGEVIYRRTVKGQRPRYYIRRARDEVAGRVEEILTDGAERATARLF